MRGHTVLTLTAIAVCGFVVGLPWAYLWRDHEDTHWPAWTLFAASVLGLLAVGVYTLRERAPGGLTLPGGVTHLPSPAWWAPMWTSGLLDLATGPMVGFWLAALGTVFCCVALMGMSGALRDDPPIDRHTVRVARTIRLFGMKHALDGDGRVDAMLTHVARGGTRIIMVGRDGAFGDQYLPTSRQAVLATVMAEVEIHESFPPEIVAKVKTGRADWQRMASTRLGLN